MSRTNNRYECDVTSLRQNPPLPPPRTLPQSNDIDPASPPSPASIRVAVDLLTSCCADVTAGKYGAVRSGCLASCWCLCCCSRVWCHSSNPVPSLSTPTRTRTALVYKRARHSLRSEREQGPLEAEHLRAVTSLDNK